PRGNPGEVNPGWQHTHPQLLSDTLHRGDAVAAAEEGGGAAATRAVELERLRAGLAGCFLQQVHLRRRDLRVQLFLRGPVLVDGGGEVDQVAAEERIFAAPGA